ncbi:uncharacterized protein LOC133727392 [Rosa rugosa]|uniref:uncharacterized protein LOC133727392 n=1 Tax=Rosa rugosa TaxID=74645 RepID=UPI002B402655|nr:uncharacterized protein LOC133727392 [Rosa rugosa]
MEASTNTVLRCVALLGMLALSSAVDPAPQEPAAQDVARQDPALQDPIFAPSKIKLLTCGKKCAISCAMSLFSPATYVGCVTLCMAACKIPSDQQISNVQETSDATYGCTRSCVTSMSNVMTTNAKLSTSNEMTTPAKRSISDLRLYAEGYVDSCFLSCNKNNKLF